MRKLLLGAGIAALTLCLAWLGPIAPVPAPGQALLANIVIGPSPWKYTSQAVGSSLDFVHLVGGVVQSVVYASGTHTETFADTGSSGVGQVEVYLHPGDTVSVTYTTAPTGFEGIVGTPGPRTVCINP